MNRFALGDCCELMPKIPAGAIDFVLTDPPWLVNFRDRSGRSIQNDSNDEWLDPAFAQIFRVLRPNSTAVCFYAWNRVDRFMHAWRAAGFRPVGHITFVKGYSSSSRFLAYRHESAYLLAKGQPPVPKNPLPDVIQWSYTGNPAHPTTKPVSALRPIIETFCPLGGLVLDPFAGSGSTCEAAASLGRRYLGIELDPLYHAAAASRLDRLHAPMRAAA